MTKKNKTVWIVGYRQFNSEAEAQECEISAALTGLDDGIKTDNADNAAKLIVANKDTILPSSVASGEPGATRARSESSTQSMEKRR